MSFKGRQIVCEIIMNKIIIWTKNEIVYVFEESLLYIMYEDIHI